MLEITKGQSPSILILTLTELTTINNAYWLLVFTHVTTKEVVAFVAPADASVYPERYNKFSINSSLLFGSKPVGEWHYAAFQQESAVNIDPLLSGGLVEQGKMNLNPAAEFTNKKYNQKTTYKAYNG